METAAIILRQIIIMFLYMAIGWWMYKKNLITQEGSRSMAHLLLYVILPCVIIQSFCVERSAKNIRMIQQSFAGAIAVLTAAMMVSHLLLKKKPVDNFGAAFSNAGFMGIPLLTATLGEQAVICAAGMIALLNALQWTYGQMILSGDRRAVSLKEVAKSPVVAALAAGMCIFLLQLPVPSMIQSSMGAIARLNAPIAMIILGVYLGHVPIREILCDKNAWKCSAVRLMVIPAITVVVLRFMFPDNQAMAMALLLSAIAPVGSNVAVYAQKGAQDYGYAVKIVCLSTLLSALSMPLIMYAYMAACSLLP